MIAVDFTYYLSLITYKAISEEEEVPVALLIFGHSLSATRRVVDPPHFLDAVAADGAFDDLVSQQREHPVPDEQRPGVAVPVNTRGAAAVVV